MKESYLGIDPNLPLSTRLEMEVGLTPKPQQPELPPKVKLPGDVIYSRTGNSTYIEGKPGLHVIKKNLAINRVRQEAIIGRK